MAANGSGIEFQCIKVDCKTLIAFSVSEIEKHKRVKCTACQNEYVFTEDLIKKIRKFETLVKAVKDAEDILGGTSVGININGHSVKVPYRLLLTRLNTLLTLKMGNEELTFHFRVEPLKEKEYTILA